ncbi:bifunctional hydroxymethylpyrimidine kinase/phosphomethylpyrimidine kinase [Nesterenkonia alba]|uniref:bifunctional hydroxymethylpyrimidine kinase/phosphomethylpyrimidine kinase n=1 Tax=Nesterenkonia alba TaxID=515814 RepID=UPI0003FA3B60|nr:bifunctional hydroxymethylpyrimidine kinase/phosphomethylpyrimidine kinase [Nesterenkonia alba]
MSQTPHISPRTVPNVLSIAGTDPTGGAGIQADLKSFAAFSTYGMCVITALVAQNTQGVRQIHIPPLEFLRAQLDAVSDDVAVDAVKTGMLGTTGIIETVEQWWDDTYGAAGPVLVVDPVMVATSGDRLLEAEAEEALIRFLDRADLITPNAPELALIAGAPPADSDAELVRQAEQVADTHDVVVLAKGGHLTDDDVVDTLVFPACDGARPAAYSLASPRVQTRNTHGTGCSVSAAFTALRARGFTWNAALDEVKPWVTAALEQSEHLEVGEGHGPIHHFAEYSKHSSPCASG